MNNTFVTWLIGAGVAVLALLLLLGAPGGEPEVAGELVPASDGEPLDAASSYWQPVVVEAPVPEIAQTPVPTTMAVTPCSPSRPAAARSTAPGQLVGGCRYPSTPCGPPPCAPLAGQCYDACADPCRVVKPGINRNMPLCVDECSFIQLHSTIAHPICGRVWFEWSASKGRFLDPTASDPLFFAPVTQFSDGEDVWITLLVTGASGASYSDVVSLHIRDLP